MKVNFSTVFCLLILIPAAFSNPDEYTVRDVTILVIVCPLRNNEGLVYQEIIASTVKIELNRARLQVLLRSDLTEETFLEGIDNGEEIDIKKICKFAERADADFVITGLYTVNENEIFIDFVWYDVQEKQVSDPISKILNINLAFDTVISDAINEILLEMKDRINDFPLLEQEITEENIPETEITPTPENENDKVDYRNKHMEIAMGFAPFISIGRANDYFKIGFIPSLYINYLFNLSFGQIGLGLYSGLNSFNVKRAGSEYNFLIPIGGDLRMKVYFKKAMSFFAHLSAGPAIFIINFNERLSKTIMFLLGGIGLNFQLTPLFGLGVDTGYIVFFEKGDPIMGFTPCFYIIIRV
jgi:hypothetical protein